MAGNKRCRRPYGSRRVDSSLTEAGDELLTVNDGSERFPVSENAVGLCNVNETEVSTVVRHEQHQTDGVNVTPRKRPYRSQRVCYDVDDCRDQFGTVAESNMLQLDNEYVASSSNRAGVQSSTNMHSDRLCSDGRVAAVPRSSRSVRSRRHRRRVLAALVTEPIPTAPAVLGEPTICVHCGAKKFEHESPGFCCSNGEVRVAINSPPQALKDLCEGHDDDALNFRKYGRLYNNLFAFSSLGGRIDCNTNKHIYVFKAHAQIYHFLPSLIPTDHGPKFMQLYFYDGQCEHDIRCGLFKELRPSVIARIMSILQCNPYAQFFHSLRHLSVDAETTISISKNPCLDQRVYNAPTSSEVAGILLDSALSSEASGPYIVVSGRDTKTHRIMHYFGCYDPLQYPLLFPFGESGWCPGLKRYKRNKNQATADRRMPVASVATIDELLAEESSVAGSTSGKCISCREYYCFIFQIRPNSFIIYMRRIFQQFYVDMYVKLENTRLDFFRNNQPSIRADLYQGIIDSAGLGEECAANVGHRVILPPSFIGGPRDMRCRYLNAMALVHRYGKPDLFITFTCNPNWIEIKNELGPGEHAQDRPDLIARIFRAKLMCFKKELVEKQCFGEVAAYIYVVEFQKRGLPHAHFLLIMKPEYKLKSPEDYDRFVSAEIPSLDQPYLRKTVLAHMMHGPCGVLDPDCSCMKEKNGRKTCRFRFPKDYSAFTTTNSDGYPAYRRRNTGESVMVRRASLDNRWVIPYNPYLVALFDCHVNVEVCSTVNAVKYLYKYVYKGHDRIAFNLRSTDESGSLDEIEQYQRGRWISPPEAAWRIAGFSLYEMNPPVMPLQVHLSNMQSVSFSEHESVSSIVSDELRARTPLTEFFRVNRHQSGGCGYLYSEMPEHFTWDTKRKVWIERQRKLFKVGRLTFVTPSEGERFYLRLLLTEVRGPTSFEDLRTVDGVVYSTFQGAAEARGLVEKENLVERCLDEAISVQMPQALRRLFVTLLVFCHPPNPQSLWDKYYPYLSEDYRHMLQNAEPQILLNVCRCVTKILESMGKDLETFGLGHLYQEDDEDVHLVRDIQDALEAPIPQEFLDARKMLNCMQKEAYKCIMSHIKSCKPGLFFVDGPGGTGKTFLYNALYAKVRSLGKIVLPTASSGIAASNLPSGRTAHSRFKIPIDHENFIVCNVPKQGALAALLKETSLIIWDEAPMANKSNIHSLDVLLRDIGESDVPFGGKVVVMGGDFRQVLPVVPHKSKEEAIDASLVSSLLWSQFIKFHLHENMRAREDPSFAHFLVSLGDGKLQGSEIADISLPSDLVVVCSDEVGLMGALLDHIFPELRSEQVNSQIFIDRAILAPRNDDVDFLNSFFIEQFEGESVVYKSFDKLLDDSCNIYPTEFLNTLAPGGMSPHELILKKDCPVMLLRNIDPSGGLCNGTRLLCRQFFPNVIVCEIASGSYKGEHVMIPRVHLRPSPSMKLPFQFQRTQFPIKLCFAMTINKAQGQTLSSVGVYLRQPCFSHGQLYVALSRVRRSSNLKVILYASEFAENRHCVRNVVSYEVLRRAGII